MSCGDINFSVNENCSGTVTADMILEGNNNCPGPYTVDIYDENGDIIPTSPSVNESHIGRNFTVRVTSEETGNHCWANMLVEDKMPPMVDCDTVVLNCYDMINYDEPAVSDNCSDTSEIEVTLLNEEVNTLDCDTNYIKEVIRTYQAVDGNGAVSQPCEKVFLLERIDLDAVEFPEDHSIQDENPLHCDEGFPTDPFGNPAPSYTGVPQIDGIDLYPIGNFYCNINVTYQDFKFPKVNCVQKIMRTWTVNEWWCSQEEVVIEQQLIEIVDEDGPSIQCPDDITVTTSQSSCNAMVWLPPADVSDNCNGIESVDVTFPGGFLNNSNGGFVTLPGGTNEITYTAYDNCYNSSSCTMTVTVVDETPPVAVCDVHTAVSLNNYGTAKVYAETFDDGSHDECAIDSFAVRRMNPACGYDTQFRPWVEFSCCDVGSGPIMVVMRVWDEAGNTNECMVEVEVQDKLPAIVSCPPDITVSCEFPFDLWDLSDFGTVVPLDSMQQLSHPNIDPRDSIVIDDPGSPDPQPKFWGLDGYAFDNCDISIQVDSSSSFGQCGEGKIYRTFTAMGPGGPVDQCTQVITVKNYDPFYINQNDPNDPDDDVEWPDDYTVHDGCDAGSLDPGDLPTQFGYPIVDEDECDLVGIGFDDWVFNINDPNDPACFKILRDWKIINWCEFENGTYTVYTYTQVLKVHNSMGPTITGNCDSLSVCSYDPNCGPAFIELTQTANDDCTPDSLLFWSFDIDFNNDGTFDTSGLGNDASGVYPIGTHRLIWTVEDKCGNKETCTQIFEIRNCKQPNAYCLDGLSANLMPMDLDGDGEPETGMIELWAEDFDAGSNHPCGYDVTVSFSPDPTDQSKVFDCSDVGMNTVPIWVTDINGNQSQCNASIDIQDNNNVCDDDSISSTGGFIAGAIYTPDQENLSGVNVRLGGDASKEVMTNNNGGYAFSNLEMGMMYTVTPILDKEPLEGVTTYDLVLMQKHILGKKPFSSPYQYIAGDINRTGEVTAADIVELRKLILGITEDFMSNTSWRFVSEDYKFTSNDPAGEDFAETVMFDDFTESMMDVGFKAVKIGDINLSVDRSGLQSVEDRDYTEPLTFWASDRVFKAGKSVEIPVYAENFRNISGYQFTFSFDPSVLNITDVRSGTLPVEAGQHFGFNRLDKGMLTTSWNDAFGISRSQSEPLFTLVADLTKDTRLNEVLSMTSDWTEAVAYDEQGRDMNVSIDYREDQTLAQSSFELMQNRPNPFEDRTTIAYVLPEATDAQLKVFDVDGRLLYEAEQASDKGYNEWMLNTSELNRAGVMYYQLSTNEYTATKKMIVIQ